MEIKGKMYSGYLPVTDIGELPKPFFVLLNNRIMGDLFFRYGDWLFAQGGPYKILGKLTEDEYKLIAACLGNIGYIVNQN
jgi:hypothetical protein